MHKVDWIETNGVWLRFAEDGQGETTIILVHELGGTLDSWDDVVPALADNYRVLRYDMRGFGLSQKVFGSYTLEDAVGDLESFIDAMDISGPIALVGAAVGAGVAMRLAAKEPDKIQALIALAPATELSAEGKEGAKQFPELMVKLGLRAMVEANLDAVYPEPLRTNPERLRRFRAQQGSGDPEGYLAAFQMLVDGVYAPFLPKIQCPSLVAAGEYDVVRPPEMVEPVAKLIPGVNFKTVPSGHFMATQTPELVNELIAEGLSSSGL